MPPKIIFMARDPRLCKAWTEDLAKLSNVGLNLKWFDSPVEISVQHCNLQDLKIQKGPGRTAIVSPGNSLGCMGGGLDQAIGSAFSPNSNFRDTEALIQKELHNGYSPPGCVKMITIRDSDLQGSLAFHKLGANTILHAPTMRVPESLVEEGFTEAYRLVFDLTWEILGVVDSFNKNCLKMRNRIETVVFSGLGTGYGKIPSHVCSSSMIAATGIFLSDYSLEEKQVFALRYQGFSHNALLKTPASFPKGKFSFKKDNVYNLFKD